MRKQLIHAVLAAILCVSAHAQTREVTDSGAFISDASGRYVRLEGPDHVVVNYLYDTPKSQEPSGIAVQPVPNVTLTVRFEGSRRVTVAGLPTLTSLFDHEGRTTAVHANGKTVADFDYSPSGLFAAVTLPARLRWTVSAPDASSRLLQTVQDATGKVIAQSVVPAGAEGVGRGASYEAAAADLQVNPQSLTYEQSPTGALTTARDTKGRVAFYVVHADACDVGFAADGTPRFYDLKLSVFGGTMAPGSDLVVSPAWDTQRSVVPNHLVLTLGNAIGLYVESPASKSIVTAWASGDGKTCTAVEVKAEE